MASLILVPGWGWPSLHCPWGVLQREDATEKWLHAMADTRHKSVLMKRGGGGGRVVGGGGEGVELCILSLQ